MAGPSNHPHPGAPVTLRGVSTVVPATVLPQDRVRDVFAMQPGLSRLHERLITTSFNLSAIETRYSVIDELNFDERRTERHFFDPDTCRLLTPSTGYRNELYRAFAPALFVAAAKKALAACPDIDAADVTHVITASCTGFFAPGPDFVVARELNLRRDVQRSHLGFIGCNASMPALRTAMQFVVADPNAVVLVIALELCTLHLRPARDQDSIVGASLFADGAGAAIVSTRQPVRGEVALQLDRITTAVTDDGADDMVWTIGDTGYNIILTSRVPQIIGREIAGVVGALVDRDPAIDRERLGEAVAYWAIHPGGRSILDRVQAALALSDRQLEASRGVLRDYGNISSATLFFVLRRMLGSIAAESSPPASDGSSPVAEVGEPERLIALSFGPGLTVDSALATIVRGAS